MLKNIDFSKTVWSCVTIIASLPGILRGKVPTALLLIEDSLFDTVAGNNRCME